MTLIEEATEIMEAMPKENQQIVVDLLRIMSQNKGGSTSNAADKKSFKRTGQSDFKLPVDFDEHFGDLDQEIASMFYGDNT